MKAKGSACSAGKCRESKHSLCFPPSPVGSPTFPAIDTMQAARLTLFSTLQFYPPQFTQITTTYFGCQSPEISGRRRRGGHQTMTTPDKNYLQYRADVHYARMMNIIIYAVKTVYVGLEMSSGVAVLACQKIFFQKYTFLG